MRTEGSFPGVEGNGVQSYTYLHLSGAMPLPMCLQGVERELYLYLYLHPQRAFVWNPSQMADRPQQTVAVTKVT